MHTTLTQIAGDRSADPSDRALAEAMLAILPRLRDLRKDGYGELTAVMVAGKVKRVKLTLTDNVES